MNRFKENHPLTKENLENLKLDFCDYLFYVEVYVSKYSSDKLYHDEMDLIKSQTLRALHIIMDITNNQYQDTDEHYIDMLDYITTVYGILRANEYAPELCNGPMYEDWISQFREIANKIYEETEFSNF